MTVCPACGFDNLSGTDTCSSCSADLTSLDEPSPSSQFEEHIMATRLRHLAGDKPIVVKPSTPLREVVRLLHEGKQGCVLVGDAANPVAGIFGERAIMLRLSNRTDDWMSEPVGDHMTASPVTLHESATIAHAINKMDVGDYRHIPIVDSAGRPKAVLSIKAILRHLYEYMHA